MRDLATTGFSDRDLAEAVKQLIRGHGNFVITVTLAVGTTTTVVSASMMT